MDELSHDLLIKLLEKLDFRDIAELSLTSSKLYDSVLKYDSFRHGTSYLGTRRLDANIALILAANDGDLRFMKYLVNYYDANDWKKACGNTKHQYVIDYLHNQFKPKKLFMSENDSIHIKKFNMKDIQINNIGIISKPGCGSSTLIKDILYHLRDDIEFAIAMSNAGEYNSIIGDAFAYNGFNNDALQKYWDWQKKSVRKRGKRHPKNRFLFILDCFADNNILKNNTIRSMMMMVRHYETTFVWSMQYALGIAPDLRPCFDYVFITRETNFSNKRKLYDHYCGIIPSFEMFSTILDKLTENYGVLVVNMRVHSNKIEDNIFWYKAERHCNFELKSKSKSDRILKTL